VKGITQYGAGNSAQGSSTSDIDGMYAAFTDSYTSFDHDGDEETLNISLTDALNLVVKENFPDYYDYYDYKLMGWENSVGCYPVFFEITRYIVELNYGFEDDYYDFAYVGDTDGILYAGPTGDTQYSYSEAERDGYSFNAWYTEQTDGILIIDSEGVKNSIAGYTDAAGKWLNTSDIVIYA